MTAALISATQKQAPAGGATGNTPAIDTTGANALFAYTAVFGGSALSDSAGNTWINSPPTITPDGFNCNGTLWYAQQPIITSASHTFAASGVVAAIAVSAWSGMVTSSLYDTQSAGTAGTAATRAAGTVTPGQSNSVILAGVSDAWTGTLSVDSGFTIIGTPLALVGGTAFAIGWAYLVESTAAATNPTFTFSGGSANAGARSAVFKATAATVPNTAAFFFAA